jgi:hypothetical protein
MMAAIIDIVRFARTPVLVASPLPLAVKRNAQNGNTPAKRVKYAETSLMLNHMPYSSFVVARAIMSWNMRPVATLRILAVKTMKPVYRSRISFPVKTSPCYACKRFDYGSI